MSKLGHMLRESKSEIWKEIIRQDSSRRGAISKPLQKSRLKYDKAAIAFLQTHTMNPHEKII